MIITIAGTAGSGKSTLAKNLIKHLGAKRIYVGGIRRELARSKGMSLEQLNEYGKTHPETDIEVDEQASKEAKEFDKQGLTVIVEGRVQFHFLPKSIKLYIKVDPLIAAKRIFQETKNQAAKTARNEETYQSIEELAQHIKERTAGDTKRYLKYYKIDDTDLTHYDFVLDTANITEEQALAKVISYIKSVKNKV